MQIKKEPMSKYKTVADEDCCQSASGDLIGLKDIDELKVDEDIDELKVDVTMLEQDYFCRLVRNNLTRNLSFKSITIIRSSST